MPALSQCSPTRKIEFDLSQISPEGLIGPPDGLRSLRYEFCIPADDQMLAEVRAIAPEIQCYRASRGRIGCSREHYLCINETHHPNWQATLRAIAGLDNVTRIIESLGE